MVQKHTHATSHSTLFSNLAVPFLGLKRGLIGFAEQSVLFCHSMQLHSTNDLQITSKGIKRQNTFCTGYPS